jgi:hypothetical protein
VKTSLNLPLIWRSLVRSNFFVVLVLRMQPTQAMQTQRDYCSATKCKIAASTTASYFSTCNGIYRFYFSRTSLWEYDGVASPCKALFGSTLSTETIISGHVLVQALDFSRDPVFYLRVTICSKF